MNVKYSITNSMCCRIGYLYGTFTSDNGVRVEAIYEPPQESSDVSFTILEDPQRVSCTALENVISSCVIHGR